MSVFDPFFGVLDSILGPMFALSPENQKLSLMIGIFTVSVLIALITTIVTSKVIDQEEMKSNKRRLKEFQEKLKTTREKGDEKKLKKIQSQMLEVQSEVMKGSFKPMLYTFVPIIIVFQWLSQYETLQTYINMYQHLVTLPFTLPIFGSELGWLGWYIVCSFMSSTVIRKVFNLHM